MDEILTAFAEESKSIIDQMISILEQIDEDPARFNEVVEFARLVDGIMGNAKVISLDFPPEHLIHKIANFAELCRFIGRQSESIESSPQVSAITVAFLLDASESLRELNDSLARAETIDLKTVVNAAFLNRLHALSKMFDSNRKSNASVSKDSAKSAQDDIDAILKQLSGG